jgi:uncharacterized protein
MQWRRRGSWMDEPRFVADAMLGRLTRWLRALRYDTLHFRDAPDRRLLALADRRRLLTQDVLLGRRTREQGLLVRAHRLEAQLEEVVAACGLAGRRALSRCLECNTILVETAREAVQGPVPP